MARAARALVMACAQVGVATSSAACFPSLEQYYPPEGSAAAVGSTSATGSGGGGGSAPCTAFGPVETLAADQAGPRALYVSDEAVFWVDETPGGRALATVEKTAGATPEILLDETAMYAGGPLFFQPALDLTGDGTRLFWVMGNDQANSLIVSTDESGAELAYTGAAEYPDVEHLAVDGANVFYLFHSALYKCPKAQACPPMSSHVPVAEGTGTLLALALDGGRVYFTDLDGSVRSVSKGGGEAPVVLAEGQGSAFGIVADEGGVYWTTDGGAVRASIGVAPPTDLATGRDAPTAIALDGEALYWVEPGARLVMCAPRSGGEALVLASDQNEPFDVAVDDTGVYWVNRGGGEVVARRRNPR